jgi:hypothetical protein
MRSPLVVALAALLSACAIGVDGSGESVATDAGSHHDAAPFGSKDAASPTPTQTADAGAPEASTTFDAGSNNNNSGCSFSGVLATYDFTGQPGNQTSTNPTQTASGVTAGAITRSTVTPTSGADSINSSNWGTSSSIDKTRYYTFSITPSGSCALDLTSVSITTKASSTGPTSAAIATSDDQFANATAFTPGSTSSEALSVSGATGAVEVRVYGYGASGAGGTLRVGTTLTVSGALH